MYVYIYIYIYIYIYYELLLAPSYEYSYKEAPVCDMYIGCCFCSYKIIPELTVPVLCNIATYS